MLWGERKRKWQFRRVLSLSRAALCDHHRSANLWGRNVFLSKWELHVYLDDNERVALAGHALRGRDDDVPGVFPGLRLGAVDLPNGQPSVGLRLLPDRAGPAIFSVH